MSKSYEYWERKRDREIAMYNAMLGQQLLNIAVANRLELLTADDIAAAFSPVKPNQKVYEYEC